MQRTNFFEILLSATVIVLGAGFLVFTLWQTGTGSLKSYSVTARLKNADGVKPGTDVRIAGIKVGEVSAMTLNPGPYTVDLTLAIRDDIRIPADSRLGIGGGALSSAALTIAPGRSKAAVPPGGTLTPR